MTTTRMKETETHIQCHEPYCKKMVRKTKLFKDIQKDLGNIAMTLCKKHTDESARRSL